MGMGARLMLWSCSALLSLTSWCLKLVQETAINIGFACSLLRNDMTQYIISANLPEILALEEAGKQEEAYALAHTKIGEQLQDALQCMAEAKAAGGADNALVIDGKALLHGLAHDLKAQLLQASSAPLAVVQQCSTRLTMCNVVD